MLFFFQRTGEKKKKKKKKSFLQHFYPQLIVVIFYIILFYNVRFGVSCWLVICLWFWFLHISLQRVGWFSFCDENGRMENWYRPHCTTRLLFLCFLLTVKTNIVIYVFPRTCTVFAQSAFSFILVCASKAPWSWLFSMEDYEKRI